MTLRAIPIPEILIAAGGLRSGGARGTEDRWRLNRIEPRRPAPSASRPARRPAAQLLGGARLRRTMRALLDGQILLLADQPATQQHSSSAARGPGGRGGLDGRRLGSAGRSVPRRVGAAVGAPRQAGATCSTVSAYAPLAGRSLCGSAPPLALPVRQAGATASTVSAHAPPAGRCPCGSASLSSLTSW
jgi:hypothetical protein